MCVCFQLVLCIFICLCQIADILQVLLSFICDDSIPMCRNGFQKLDKIKDPSRQSKQLEELTGKMRECKR